MKLEFPKNPPVLIHYAPKLPSSDVVLQQAAASFEAWKAANPSENGYLLAGDRTGMFRKDSREVFDTTDELLAMTARYDQYCRGAAWGIDPTPGGTCILARQTPDGVELYTVTPASAYQAKRWPPIRTRVADRPQEQGSSVESSFARAVASTPVRVTERSQGRGR